MKTLLVATLSLLLNNTAGACGVSDADKTLFQEYVRKVSIIDGELTQDGVRECDEIIFHINNVETTNKVLSSLVVTVYSKDGNSVIARYGSSITGINKASSIASACIDKDYFVSSELTFNLTEKPVATKNVDGAIIMSQVACLESKTFRNMEFLREGL